MKLSNFLVRAAALAIVSVPAFATTTQDFNAYGAGTGLGAGNAEGVASPLTFPDFVLSSTGGLQLDAPGYYGAVNYELLGAPGADLLITFNVAQGIVSLNLRDFAGYSGNDTISVYAADDTTLLNSYVVALPGDGSIVTFSDPGEVGPIGAVDLSVIGGAGWSGILQSVTYGSATPEPASEALVGLGLVGLFGILRRRQAIFQYKTLKKCD